MCDNHYCSNMLGYAQHLALLFLCAGASMTRPIEEPTGQTLGLANTCSTTPPAPHPTTTPFPTATATTTTATATTTTSDGEGDYGEMMVSTLGIASGYGRYSVVIGGRHGDSKNNRNNKHNKNNKNNKNKQNSGGSSRRTLERECGGLKASRGSNKERLPSPNLPN